MRIHTNLKMHELEAIPVTPGVQLYALNEHGSRTHDRAFEVILSGNSVFRGQYGASDFKTATWDEWGVYLGRLFGLDPKARVANVYRDARHFHYVTNWRYDPSEPLERLCPRHRWERDHDTYYKYCTKCNASINLDDPYATEGK